LFFDGATGSDRAKIDAVLDAVADATQARLGVAPLRAERGDCNPLEACARQSEGDPVIIVRVIAAVTTTRVLLQVLDGPRTTVDLPVDRGTWASALDAGVAVILPASTTHHGPRAWAPWALLGAGLASAAAGVAFGVSAQDASNALSVGLPSPESRELLDRSAAHGTAANLLWLTAAASVLTGMVWVTLDP